MKKLMILAAVAAMAVSAQAVYDFQLTIKNIPEGMKLGENSGYYLIDKSSGGNDGKILAYAVRNELTQDVGHTESWWSGKSLEHNQDVSINGETYSVMGHTVQDASMYFSGDGESFQVGLKFEPTESMDMSSYRSDAGEAATRVKDLWLVIADPDYSNYMLKVMPTAGSGLVVQDTLSSKFSTGALDNTFAWSSKEAFSATVTFTPEPTSGLLLLLGFAGLALRRRRA